jgi:capsular polysaccharide export protein
MGMRHSDLASATGLTWYDADGQVSAAPKSAGRIELRCGEADAAVLAALLPDFRTERGRATHTNRDGLSGVIALSGPSHKRRLRAGAAALGVPLVLFGRGVLGAPPQWAGAARLLSATAHATTGPSSPVDILDPARVLATRAWESSALLARAAAARRGIVSQRLGGAWWHPRASRDLLPRDGFALIVAEETGGFGAGSSSHALLRRMLAAALAERAARQIVILDPGHSRRGSLSSPLTAAASRGCTVLTVPVEPWDVIERAQCVYGAGGETPFLALIAGVKVRCFAGSFYSGWGVTQDEAGVPQKPFSRTVDEIFAGACLVATRYLDPYRKKAAGFENTFEIAEEWRKIDAENRRIAVCLGMSFWKRRQVADFLRSSAGYPAFRRSTRAALAAARAGSGSAVAVWASRAPAGLANAAKQHRVPLIRVEDGFVRSVGLGSDFLPPASLVLDSRGMHFDPNIRSDLELILRDTEFGPALIGRGRNLIAQLVSRGVTKYNLGSRLASVDWPPGKPRILVPGQVEDDLSVRLGGEGIWGNLDLLRRVRAANPDAFILYKPHPDVEAGHRKGRVPDEVARRFADIIIRDVSTAAVLAEIDELHTLTSLAGFEALLRRRRVVVYGRPFYSGWGLTTDLAVIDHGRRLTLEELVAGALILYPRYLDPVTRLPCGPEIIIERLADPALWRPGLLVAARRLQGALARRWGELAGAAAKLPAGRFARSGRDELRTPPA